MGRVDSRTSHTVRERSFHDWLRRTLPPGRGGLLALGDDAAAFRLGTKRVLLATTDSFSEGWHFLRSSRPVSVGRALAGVNLSDLAAKGAQPIGFLIDLLVPPGTERAWAQGVVRGAERLCASFDCHIVGGDTKPASTRIIVGTALGVSQSGKLAPRTAARPGDVIAVTGSVGRGGLAALELQTGVGGGRRLSESFLDIRPRVKEGILLAPRVHAMLDTSDGVAEATHLLAEASGVKIVLEGNRLPIHPELTRRMARRSEVLRHAFYGGDYELLCAVAPAQLSHLQSALTPLHCRFSAVGRVCSGHGAWLSEQDRIRPLPRAGWQPFGRE